MNITFNLEQVACISFKMDRGYVCVLFYGHTGRIGPSACVHRLVKGGIASKLTIFPRKMCKADTEALKTSEVLGANDGEILEANQIIGYSNYVSGLLYGL